MSPNNTFSLPRFLKLVNQNFVHNKKLILLTVVGFSGLLFILFFLIQLSNNLQQATDPEIFVPVFMVIFLGGAVLFSGNAFPSFRSKEKTFSYLTLPTSALEKFILEISSRLVILFILIPAFFWLIFHFEGFVFQLFYPEASFEMMDLSSVNRLFPDEDFSSRIKPLIASLVLMALLVAFTGAAHFERYPLVKTAFIVAVLFFSTLAIMYVIIEKMGLGKYNPNDSLWLFPNSAKQAVTFFTTLVLIVDVVLIMVSYLKLKEKEV